MIKDTGRTRRHKHKLIKITSLENVHKFGFHPKVMITEMGCRGMYEEKHQ